MRLLNIAMLKTEIAYIKFHDLDKTKQYDLDPLLDLELKTN
jgi:hypothetical protein